MGPGERAKGGVGMDSGFRRNDGGVGGCDEKDGGMTGGGVEGVTMGFVVGILGGC